MEHNQFAGNIFYHPVVNMGFFAPLAAAHRPHCRHHRPEHVAPDPDWHD